MENQETNVSEAPVEEISTTPVDPVEAPADPAAQLAAMTAERDQLAQEKADLSDRLLRQRAEFENFRKRTERDRIDFVQFAGSETVREILPVVDDLERALKVPTADVEYRKGVELIHQRLVDALQKAGLERVECAGHSFDPNLHQAVSREETTEVDDQTILEEFQRGYKFKGKLLRPAMVKVAVKPS